MLRLPLTVALLALPALALAQGQAPPAPVKLTDPTLAVVLNEASVIELSNQLGANSGNLLLRLYAVAKEGTCVPETHWVCSYRYWLAVSEVAEEPSQVVYYLGEYGELTTFTPGPPSAPDAASFNATSHTYARVARKRNPVLRDAPRKLLFSVGLDTLLVVPTP